MGIADSIPGISGGTVAFISGIYPRLLAALSALGSLKLRQVDWPFLLLLVSGIAFGLIGSAHLVHLFLSRPLSRCLLFALFSGLILASALQCAKRVSPWKRGEWTALLIGAVAAFFLTGWPGLGSAGSESPLLLIAIGALCGGAMILPGISGASLLALLGTYEPAIGALIAVVRGHFDALWLLVPLGIGLLIGLLLFARGVNQLFIHFPSITTALLTGVMVGAVRSLWPLSPGDGPLYLGGALLSGALGFSSLLFIEKTVAKEA